MESSNGVHATDAVEQRLEKLEQEFVLQIAEPQGGDVRISACNLALQELYEQDTLRGICQTAFERRSELNAVHANRLIVRAIQKHGLRRADTINYPLLYTEKEPWLMLGADVLETPSTRREFKHDILKNSIQTNVAERGKVLKILPLLMGERFDHPLRVLDIGCGRNHVAKKLMINSHNMGLQFEPMKVNKPTPEDNLGSRENIIDPNATAKINQLLKFGKIAVAEVLGIDKESMRVGRKLEWVRSQFYPTEYLNPACLEEFDFLEASSPHDVHFRKADITDAVSSKRLRDAIMRQGPYDFVFFSTVLYQLTHEGRQIAEEFATQAVNPDNGIKIYQDFIGLDPGDPNKIVFADHWAPYTYQTIIEDMRDPGRKELLFVWRSGRCDQVQIGPAKLNLGDESVAVQDLLVA